MPITHLVTAKNIDVSEEYFQDYIVWIYIPAEFAFDTSTLSKSGFTYFAPTVNSPYHRVEYIYSYDDGFPVDFLSDDGWVCSFETTVPEANCNTLFSSPIRSTFRLTQVLANTVTGILPFVDGYSEESSFTAQCTPSASFDFNTVLDPLFPGEMQTFTFTVENTGGSTLQAGSFSGTIYPMDFSDDVVASPDTLVLNPDNEHIFSWPVPALEPGESLTYSLQMLADFPVPDQCGENHIGYCYAKYQAGVTLISDIPENETYVGITIWNTIGTGEEYFQLECPPEIILDLEHPTQWWVGYENPVILTAENLANFYVNNVAVTMQTQPGWEVSSASPASSLDSQANGTFELDFWQVAGNGSYSSTLQIMPSEAVSCVQVDMPVSAAASVLYSSCNSCPATASYNSTWDVVCGPEYLMDFNGSPDTFTIGNDFIIPLNITRLDYPIDDGVVSLTLPYYAEISSATIDGVSAPLVQTSVTADHRFYDISTELSTFQNSFTIILGGYLSGGGTCGGLISLSAELTGEFGNPGYEHEYTTSHNETYLLNCEPAIEALVSIDSWLPGTHDLQITVNNIGNIDFYDARILPEPAVAYTITGSDIDDFGGNYNLGPLDVGESKTLNLTIEISEETCGQGEFFHFQALGDYNELNLSGTASTSVQQPEVALDCGETDINLVIVNKPDVIEAGGTYTVDLELHNNSNFSLGETLVTASSIGDISLLFTAYSISFTAPGAVTPFSFEFTADADAICPNIAQITFLAVATTEIGGETLTDTEIKFAGFELLCAETPTDLHMWGITSGGDADVMADDGIMNFQAAAIVQNVGTGTVNSYRLHFKDVDSKVNLINFTVGTTVTTVTPDGAGGYYVDRPQVIIPGGYGGAQLNATVGITPCGTGGVTIEVEVITTPNIDTNPNNNISMLAFNIYQEECCPPPGGGGGIVGEVGSAEGKPSLDLNLPVKQLTAAYTSPRIIPADDRADRPAKSAGGTKVDLKPQTCPHQNRPPKIGYVTFNEDGRGPSASELEKIAIELFGNHWNTNVREPVEPIKDEAPQAYLGGVRASTFLLQAQADRKQNRRRAATIK